MSGVTKAKKRHDLNDEALGNYLIQHLPNLQLPVVSMKIGYCQSNPTYFVDDARNTRYILRKKPSRTIISPVAHQVDREYRVIKALGSVEGFPVPKVYCLCIDDAVIGTPFYVGHVFHTLPASIGARTTPQTSSNLHIHHRSWNSSRVA